MIRVAVVDHSATYRFALRSFLAFTAPNIQIIGEGSQTSDALALLECSDLDILLVGVDIAWANGKAVLERRRQSKSPVQIVIMSAYRESELEQEFLADGAAACLVKCDISKQLVPTLYSIHQGGYESTVAIPFISERPSA
jgi:DNA-binding NarL/FixJ family response regulator